MSSSLVDVDIAVLDALPSSTTIVSVESQGHSDWTKTYCVSGTLPDGSSKKWFLKCAVGEVGRIMLQGEYTASQKIWESIPSFIPKPLAWGQTKESSEETYFFLAEHRDMDATFDRKEFLRNLAKLHQETTSPDGRFGFSVTTCDGAVPHVVEWQQNWGDFFTRLLGGVLEHDEKANGPMSGLSELVATTTQQVIPRLLGRLKQGGHSIKPSLIHGDMYEGNVGTDRSNGRVMIFDASSYYAHNEMELGLWRWSPGMAGLIEEYWELVPPSEPVEEWDDRNRLYSLKTKFNLSADHPGPDGRRMRQIAYEDLEYLCSKYARQ